LNLIYYIKMRRQTRDSEATLRLAKVESRNFYHQLGKSETMGEGVFNRGGAATL
jgi:hypothetical protein